MAYKFADSIQRGIIYLLKSDKDFYLEIINLVKPEYFEYEAHSKVYETVIHHYNTYKVLPTDNIIVNTIKENSPSITVSEYEDELEYINKLDVTSIQNRNYFLDIIENFAKKEAIKVAIAKSINLIKEENYGEIEVEIKRALSINRTLDLGQNYFLDINDRWDRLSNLNVDHKFPTVFTRANDALEGGPARKELCMVVAPPGVGKSLYLVNQGVTALKQNKNVLYISLEMSEDRIGQRFDSVMSLIPQSALKTNQEGLKRRLEIFKHEFPGGRLIIKEFPTGRANANTVRALINQLINYEEFKPDVLILDYLELLRPTTEGMAEYQAQERIAQEIRGVAVEYNLLLWTATQTNRQGSKAEVITDVDLGDSYGKIRTCDFAISLNQQPQEFDAGEMRVFVMKSRNGKQKFLFKTSVNYDTLEMSDYVGDGPIDTV
jgi:replicative DNA helicase